MSMPFLRLCSFLYSVIFSDYFSSFEKNYHWEYFTKYEIYILRVYIEPQQMEKKAAASTPRGLSLSSSFPPPHSSLYFTAGL